MNEVDLLSIGSWAIFDHLAKMNRYPAEGQTVTLDMPIEGLDKVFFGDCSANVAAVAARLGLRTGLAMVVGEDFVQSGYARHLEALAVDLSAVEVKPGERSGHNYIYFDAQGNGFCLSHLGVAADQSSWAVPEMSIAGAKVVVINEMFSDYTLRSIMHAKAAGKLTVINGMLSTAGENARAFLSHTDILFISHGELRDLLELLSCQNTTQLHELGPQKVFVTHGASGSELLKSGTCRAIEPIPATQVVDSTGAGDSYVAGTLAALLKRYSDEQAAAFGAAVASFVIEAWGAQENIPTWREAEERARPYLMEVPRENH